LLARPPERSLRFAREGLISSRQSGRRANAAGVAVSGAVFFVIDSTQSARLALLTAYALFTIACAAFPTSMRCSPDDTLTSIAKI